MTSSGRALRVALIGFALATQATLAQQAQKYSKWDQYGGASDSMQYSTLAEINKSNVKQLERVWFYPVPGEPDRLLFNPLIVDNVMYVSGVRGVVVALDAATGKELWMSTLRATERGLAYWESKDRSDRRLILTANNGIREIDARTGQQILAFGTKGFVDMRIGSPRRNGGPNNSPGRVFENLIIVGSNVGEGYGSPPGDIRAYDVITGKLVWTFHTIPRPGEFGYETWPPEAYKYAGGANTWGDLTVDDTNGIVFVMNEGTIKWRVADGVAPGVAGTGLKNTGTVRPRNGPVVTAGGLVFLANSQDSFLRAFDKTTGQLVWEHALEANPEGVPAVYQANGRQYIAFAAGASWGAGGDPVRNPLHRKEGKIEAQGYHVFALPERK